MTQKEKRRRKQVISIALLILAFIPSALVLIGLSFINLGGNENRPTYTPAPTLPSTTGLNPSDIINNVLFYQDKIISLQGKIVLGEQSCDQRACDPSDKCCGCNTNRNLVVRNTSTDLLSNSSEIKIFYPNQSSICQRKVNSCDYDCGDWEIGANYDITGKFIVDRPLGETLTRGFLDYYLEVTDKTKIITPTTSVPFNNILNQFIPKFFPNIFKSY